MVKFLLICTGTTEYESQGRIQGTLDVPLSEDGREQVEDVVEAIRDYPIEAVYSGPCQATRQSASLIAEHFDLKVKSLDKLCNLNHGLWQGMLIDDVKTKQPKVYRQWQEHPENICPPEGETLSTARDRVQAVLAKIARKHKNGTVALVVLEPLRSVIRNLLREDALSDLWQIESGKYPAWEILEYPTQNVGSQ